MKSRFPGPLRASSDFLEAIPRPAMIEAIVKHATGDQPRTTHEHAGRRFVIESTGTETRLELEP